ncbi:MAG: ATP-binding protein, partial [Planctomycetes bacterium]|nr:ATP-binding protein [Planctomycetota bacterium]
MIYAEFWGLTFPPFANDSHPETFIPTRSATMVMARLRYALGLGMGASALYGEPGSGKSRVARMILAEFTSARWAVGYLPSPFGSIRDILNVLEPAAAAVGNDSNGFYELGAMLAARAAKHQPTLLAVDDIQAARGTEFLEAIRTLLNVEHGGMRALSVLLIGQPGMERRLAAASGFDGQLIARTILEPMSDDETR